MMDANDINLIVWTALAAVLSLALYPYLDIWVGAIWVWCLFGAAVVTVLLERRGDKA